MISPNIALVIETAILVCWILSSIRAYPKMAPSIKGKRRIFGAALAGALFTVLVTIIAFVGYAIVDLAWLWFKFLTS
jgi:hypothetical protein